MCTYSTALAFAADGLAERRHVAWGTAFERRARALQAAGYTRLRVVLGQHRRRIAPVHAREIARGWHTLALWMSRQNVALPARCAACVCHVRASVTGRVAAHACGHTRARTHNHGKASACVPEQHDIISESSCETCDDTRQPPPSLHTCGGRRRGCDGDQGHGLTAQSAAVRDGCQRQRVVQDALNLCHGRPRDAHNTAKQQVTAGRRAVHNTQFSHTHTHTQLRVQGLVLTGNVTNDGPLIW